MTNVSQDLQDSLADSPSFLKDGEVANLLGLSVATIRRWRLEKHGPPYRKLTGSIRYPKVELAAWIAKQPTGGAH
jgi:predicted DNA-binding transcriptional regulator AlpA